MLDTGENGSSEQDPDLQKIISKNNNHYGGHTSSLEFELTANGELLNFNYVFASSEYDQRPAFNDVFGLFVSINGGEYENVALITRNDGTEVPVTIVNLRAGISGNEMNGGQDRNIYDVSHTLFTEKKLKYGNSTRLINGVSHIFTAQKAVHIGDKVKIKFAICDVSDKSFDSFVFIEKGSLNFNAPKSKPSYEDEYLTDFVLGEVYEFTVDGEKYIIASDVDGKIPLEGNDDNAKYYSFIGKTLAIVQKGKNGNPDSDAQIIDIAPRPNAEDEEQSGPKQGATSPAEVELEETDTSTNSITIEVDTNNEFRMSQVYCVYDLNGNPVTGATWVKPDANGKITFSGLEEGTEYIVKSKVPATETSPASKPSTGARASSTTTTSAYTGSSAKRGSG